MKRDAASGLIFELEIREPLPDFGACRKLRLRNAAQAMARRHQRLRRAGRNFKQLSVSRRHELRIDAKKVRYAAALFRALYPQQAAEVYLDSLARLQDALGELNDVVVAKSLLSIKTQSTDCYIKYIRLRSTGR